MNQTDTHNNNNSIIIVVHIGLYADSKMPPGAYLFLRNTQGMAALRVRTCQWRIQGGFLVARKPPPGHDFF